MTKEAWVTVVTNDTYGLGALVLGSSLRRVATTRDTVVLVTPGVSERMREELGRVFTSVVPVDVLDSGDSANLALMSRPELGVTFTKLHAWTLVQYSKCVFLDADTLVVQNSDELFEREELSAAPDPGWPDCFNSGVFVFVPSLVTYQALLDFAIAHGSFDGGDQGLLNMFFREWATQDIKKHLPFIYNLVASTAYTYLPALKFFGSQVKIVHFLGGNKPWTKQAESSSLPYQRAWWSIFREDVSPRLTQDMNESGSSKGEFNLTGVAGALARGDTEEWRREAWESGDVDYLGRDSFDNIWRRICECVGIASISPVQPAAIIPPVGEKPVETSLKPVEQTEAAQPGEAPATPVATEAPVIPVVAAEVSATAVAATEAPAQPAAPIEAPVPAQPTLPEEKLVETTAPALVEASAQPAAPVEPRAQPAAPVEAPTQPAASIEATVQPSTPTEVPAQPAAPVESPAQPTSPAEASAQPAAPVESPVQATSPEEIPAQPVAPVEIPAQPATPVESLIQLSSLTETSAQPPTPVETPAQPTVPAETPVEPAPAAPIVEAQKDAAPQPLPAEAASQPSAPTEMSPQSLVPVEATPQPTVSTDGAPQLPTPVEAPPQPATQPPVSAEGAASAPAETSVESDAKAKSIETPSVETKPVETLADAAVKPSEPQTTPTKSPAKPPETEAAAQSAPQSDSTIPPAASIPADSKSPAEVVPQEKPAAEPVPPVETKPKSEEAPKCSVKPEDCGGKPEACSVKPPTSTEQSKDPICSKPEKKPKEIPKLPTTPSDVPASESAPLSSSEAAACPKEPGTPTVTPPSGAASPIAADTPEVCKLQATPSQPSTPPASGPEGSEPPVPPKRKQAKAPKGGKK